MERINTNPSSETNVNWFADGERANAAVLNRPIQDVSNIINNGIIDPVNNAPKAKPVLNLDFANSKTAHHMLDVNRASFATYWSNEKVLAEQNLCVGSDTFDTNYWTHGSIVRTNDQADPFGGNKAIKIASNTASTQHYLGLMQMESFQTQSIYAKAAGKDVLRLGRNSGDYYATFDLTNGVVTRVLNGEAYMTSVGGGWWRCVYKTPRPLRNTFMVWPDGTSGILTGNGTDGIFVFGPQAENRDFALKYTPTVSSTNVSNYQRVMKTAGVDEPRIDVNPETGETKGLLVEMTSTNYMVDRSPTHGANTAIKENAGIAPDGTPTAIHIHKANNSLSYIWTVEGHAMGALSTYTGSVFVKDAGAGHVRVNVFTTETADQWIGVDLTTGEVEQVTTKIQSHTVQKLDNGWWRISITLTSESAATNVQWQLVRQHHLTDDWSEHGGVLAWGIQVEDGAFPTSYIPSSGVATTRSGDLIDVDLSDYIDNGDITVYAEAYKAATINPANGSSLFNVYSPDISSSRWQVRFASSDAVFLAYDYKAVAYSLNNGALTTLEPNKVCMVRDGLTNKLSMNGATPAQITRTIRSLDRIALGRYSGSEFLNECLPKISIYNVALTSDEMKFLTDL